MNILLQEVITNPKVRNESSMSAVAAASADKYLPWSDAVE